METKIVFTGKLEQYLKLRNLTLRDFCRENHINETYLSQVINHKKRPSWDMLLRIHRSTGLTIRDMVEFGDVIHA